VHNFHPLNFKHLLTTQEADKTIMKILAMENTKYELQDFHGGGKTTALICYRNKKTVISWYHTTLCHPGINRTEETIGQHLWWPNMRDHITNYEKICSVCQQNKRRQKKYGLLPPKEAEETPWDKLCVDLIGPYKIRRKGQELICKYVTMIDPATSWFEIQQYDDKQSIAVANIVEQEWFSRYPWPRQIPLIEVVNLLAKTFRK
jgi:hypothetical protein